MPIDASIYNNLQPVKIESPLNMLAKVSQVKALQNQNRLADLAYGQKQQEIDSASAVNDAYKNAVGQDGLIDRAKLYTGIAFSGQGAKLPGIQKSLTEADTAVLTQKKAALDNHLKQFEVVGQIMSGVKDQATYDTAKQQILQVLGPEAAAHQPPQYDPNVIEQARQKAMSVKDQMEQASKAIDQQLNLAKFGYQQQNDAANRSVTMRGQNMTDARMRDPNLHITRGVAGLTPEQNDALFGENGAVTTGRLDPNRINSRTARILADAVITNPNTDFSKISADIALGRNATFRQKAMTAEVLPEIMQNMVESGKKVGFSDNRTIGKMQGWVKGEFNDPDMTEYMTQRNDALMTIAGVMRGVGMTDQAHKAETEVAAPTMSPAALDAWMKGQMKSLQPRLNQNRKITRDGPPPSSPGAAKPSLDDIFK